MCVPEFKKKSWDRTGPLRVGLLGVVNQNLGHFFMFLSRSESQILRLSLMIEKTPNNYVMTQFYWKLTKGDPWGKRTP